MSAAPSRCVLESTGVSPVEATCRSTSSTSRSVRLVRQMNAECYRMLMLVREFDDRFGYAKWSFKSCASGSRGVRVFRYLRHAKRCARHRRCACCPRFGRVRGGPVVVQQGEKHRRASHTRMTKTCC